MDRRLTPEESGQQSGNPPSPGSSGDASEGVATRVFAARVRLLYSDVWLMVLGNVATGAVLAFVQHKLIGTGVVLGWFGFLCASVVGRVVLVRWFLARAPENEEMGIWARRYTFATAWTGTAWGAAAVFMLPEASSPHQIVTLVALAGMAAGAVTTLSRLYVAYLAYVLPILAPLAVRLLLMGGEAGYGIAAMCILFLAYLLRAGYQQGQDLERAQTLALENESLVVDLTAQKATADKLNAELRQEASERECIAADLRKREASLANAQRIAGIASWEWDLKANEIRGSDEAYRIFSIDREVESITFEDFLAMVHPDDRDAVAQAVTRALHDDETYSVEHRAVAADGSTRVVHQRGEVLRDENGNPVWMSGTTHDITDRHRISEELRAASLRAEEASEAKSRFLANMSHEFRTPLNAIIGYSEILREDALDLGQTANVNDLERINGAGRHLLALVNEILDLSKIEAGKTELHIESLDVQELVEEAVATVRSLVEANHNTLTLDCGTRLGRMDADALRVRQMLYNLLSNAGKFTEYGEVRVTVRRISKSKQTVRDGWILIEVSDTGIGMRPDQIRTAFEAFGQLDASTTRKQGGTGLGLAITKHYCEMMGGAVSVQSEPDKGSTFTLRLPAAMARAEPSPAPATG
jgi:PAS domain S-box-containing protein